MIPIKCRLAAALCGALCAGSFSITANAQVFSAPLDASLAATGGVLRFTRPGEATYFDAGKQRIVTAPADVPRFLTVPGGEKRWGAPAGLLLEGATVNLLTDSSFEIADAPSAWTFTGAVTREAKVGVHGEHGLTIKGPAKVTHLPVKVLIFPHRRCTYLLSLYVRRKDGAAIGPNAIRCFGFPADNGPWDDRQVIQLEPQRLGDGPWYRVSARIGYVANQEKTPPQTDMLTYGFSFDGQEYYADAAQLEHAGGSSNYTVYYDVPTAYVDAGASPVARAAETLSVPAQALLPGKAWSYSLWTYVEPPDQRRVNSGSYRRLFCVWVEKATSASLLLTHRGDVQNVADGRYEVIKANKVPLTGWVYLTVTYDGQGMNFFVNGISDHGKDGPVPLSIPHPLTGTAYWALNVPPGWTGETLAPCGLIADFTTWDRALTPDEVKGLYATGIAGELPPDPNNIPVAFKLKQAGSVSLNLYDANNCLVHQLLIGKPLPAGKHRVFWDGCDDQGRPVPAGTYRLKGLVSNVRSEWDGKVANTSPVDNAEYKQYRTGNYFDVVSLPDGGLVTVSSWGEHGHVLQAIDGPPDYAVRWSADTPWVAFGIAGAVDGDRAYTVFPHWVDEKKTREAVVRWNLATGAHLPYREGGSAPVSPKGVLWLNEPHPGQTWSTSDCDRTKPFESVGVCGLAARDDRLYVPMLLENRVAILDAGNGQALGSFPAPAPRRIALDAAGRIYVTSGKQVLRFTADGSNQTAVVTGLEDACGIAVGADGKMYVTDLGASQQLKVFDSTGKRLAVFGQAGGHQGGRVALDLLQAPVGVAVDARGNIALADLGGLRILLLNPDFTLRKEIHGRMPYNLSSSQLDRSLVYQGWPGGDLMEYSIDYASRTSTITRRWSRTQQPELKGWPMNCHSDQVFFYRKGRRTFVYWPAHCAVAELVGDRLAPRISMGVAQPGCGLEVSVVPDGAAWSLEEKMKAKAAFIWRDRNGDGRLQASEFEFGDWPVANSRIGWHSGGWLDDQANMYYTQRGDRKDLTVGIVKVPCQGWDAQGLPVYSWTAAQYVVTIPKEMAYAGKGGARNWDGKLFSVRPESIIRDQAGDYYVSDQGDMFSSPNIPRAIMKFDRHNRLLWRVGRVQEGSVWHPGEVVYCGNMSGLVDDRYLFYVDYVGQMNVWDTDGLFVARLFSDLPDGLFYGAETFHGLAFRHPDNGKVYAYSSPDCIYRTMRIVVHGLEEIERFTGRVKVKTPSAPRPGALYELEWRIMPRQNTVWIDGEINAREWATDTSEQAPERFLNGNGEEAARAWAQWDPDALYLACKIPDRTPAIPAVGQPGDRLALMLRAAAGTERTGGAAYAKGECLIAIAPGEDGALAAVLLQDGGGRQGQRLPAAETALQRWPGKNGYNAELRIPWASFGNYRPSKGGRIRWNVAVEWGQETGNAQRSIPWKSGDYLDPRSWGTAVFE
ncbi:MAG: FlgD immunoglobulin-like domain containing protein [Kiritimatiellae bacterium]|nr:FlgD immunoglobulin-like domain containing protein [Kiritimatiellia bacterium]